MAVHPNSGDLLYTLACECESGFDQLHKTFLETKPDVNAAKLCAEFQQRFSIWAKHLGVFARKSQCLDTRLRNFPDLQDLVARLLDILRRSLQQCNMAMSSIDKEHSDSIDAEKIQYTASQIPKTALTAIDDSLTRLSRIGVTIRQSNRSKIDMRAQKFAESLNLKPFTDLCTNAVQTLYPSAHQSLKDYLSKSMTERYTRMLFFKFRRQNLETRRQAHIELAPIPEVSNEKQPNIIITQPAKLVNKSPLPNILAAPKVNSQSDLSSVNMRQIMSRLKPPDEASTKLHKTSSIQVNQGNYPQPPSTNEGSDIFTCEWCSESMNKTMYSEPDWRRHIDRDLKPYICLSEECPEAHPIYPTFDEWFTHMCLHNRRWHQEMYLTSSWVCVVCEFNPDVYSSPQALYSHLQESHHGDFASAQLQTISRQSKTEQPRAWNDCLLCYFAVEEQNHEGETVFPKRRKGQSKQEASKSSRKTLEMMSPDPHGSGSDSSDISSDTDDKNSLQEKPHAFRDRSKSVARHIAAHLQALMLLTLRFASLKNDEGDLDDDIKSDSVNINEGNSASQSNNLGRLSEFDSEDNVRDDDDDTMDIDDDVEQDIPVPDTEVDLGHIPRQYDDLVAEKDEFLNKVIESGAYQSWREGQEEETAGPSAEKYRIGWICAAKTAYIAARCFLDVKHKVPEQISLKDNNDYTLGKIEKHNVVIAYSPGGEYGTSSSAMLAINMVRSFRNISITFMVGIGGGAPSPKDNVRLGDIAVGLSQDGNSGLVLYDFDKTIQSRSLHKTGFINQSLPAVLHTAIKGLMAMHIIRGHLYEQQINNILQSNPRLQKKYSRPDPSSDRLYQSTVVHPVDGASSCAEACGSDASKMIQRSEQTEHNIAIHYGAIASGNQLMKDASIRDKLAAEEDILCFEMEAMGLVHPTPCLVIRGICDYSDSHNYKDWQGYAAMVAAAYAKDLLCRIPPNMFEFEMLFEHSPFDSHEAAEQYRDFENVFHPQQHPDSVEPFPAFQPTTSDIGPLINIDFAPPNTTTDALGEPESTMDPRFLAPPNPLGARLRSNALRSSLPLGSSLLLHNPGMASQSQHNQDSEASEKHTKHPATFQCTLCPKRFTRAYNLRSHLRTHTDERPFVCRVCGKAFARQHDRMRHESLHSDEKKFVCKGHLMTGGEWGCGRRFARADALGRHFRSEAGRICIKPLLDEEAIERERTWQEQRMQQNTTQTPSPSSAVGGDAPPVSHMDAGGDLTLPVALLAQYPALAQIHWPETGLYMDMDMDDDVSGASFSDAREHDEYEHEAEMFD